MMLRLRLHRCRPCTCGTVRRRALPQGGLSVALWSLWKVTLAYYGFLWLFMASYYYYNEKSQQKQHEAKRMMTMMIMTTMIMMMTMTMMVIMMIMMMMVMMMTHAGGAKGGIKSENKVLVVWL